MSYRRYMSRPRSACWLVDSLCSVHRLRIADRANLGSCSAILNPSLTFARALPSPGKVESDSCLSDDFQKTRLCAECVLPTN
jgi:hypothetical protein